MIIMKKILILGAGVGGLTTANRLSSNLSNEIRKGDINITLLDKREYHFYYPEQIFVAFGLADEQEVYKPIKQLLRPGIDLITGKSGEVTKIDLDNRKVITSDGKNYEYDYLVIATGGEYDYTLVPGLEKIESTPYFLDSAKKMREVINTIESGTVVINVARFPHTCPPAPYETVFLLDDLLRKKGIRDKVKIIFTTPIPKLFPFPEASKFLLDMFEQKSIEHLDPFTITSVDTNNKIIESKEGGKIKFDYLFGVPPEIPTKVLRDSGLVDLQSGWIPADKFTLRYPKYDDVYVLGDINNLPVSKAGSVADAESSIVVSNIVNDIRGYGLTKQFNGNGLCWVVTRIGEAATFAFDYSRPPSVASPPSETNWWLKLIYNRAYFSLTARVAL